MVMDATVPPNQPLPPPQKIQESPRRGVKRRVCPGKRVSGPHATDYEELAPGRQRRQKKRVFGCVREATGHGLWVVDWDDGQQSTIPTRQLRLEDEAAGRHPLSPAPAATAAQRQDRATTAAAAADTAEELAPDRDEPQDLDARSDDDINDLNDDDDDDEFFSQASDAEDEVENEDDRRGAAPAASPAGVETSEQRMRAATEEIAQRVGKKTTVGGVEWTVVGEVDEEDRALLSPNPQIPVPAASTSAGDADRATSGSRATNSGKSDFADPFVRLLWSDVESMCLAIDVEAEKCAGLRRWRKVTPREWGVFLGLILGSVQFVQKGANLWRPKYNTQCRPNHADYMSETRFKDIKKFASYAMAKPAAAAAGDEWWRVRGAIEGFNHTRAELFKTCGVIVLDESMSAWKPQTSKCGIVSLVIYAIWEGVGCGGRGMYWAWEGRQCIDSYT